jgi:hypothetical protein
MQIAIEQAQLDFDAPMPDPRPQDAPGEADSSPVVGSSVFLKGAQYCGQPGRVLKVSHGKAKVWWVDLDYIGHHACNSLMLAEVVKEGL